MKEVILPCKAYVFRNINSSSRKIEKCKVVVKSQRSIITKFKAKDIGFGI